MSVIARRPLLRWAVPGAALLVALGSGVAINALSASADTTLPSRSPAQLLVDIQSAQLDAASGTVVETADLGLPELPTVGGGPAGGSADMTALLTGSHTLRVWYAGPDKTRVAMIGGLGESDVIHNGSDVWIWSSSKNEAQHAKITPRSDQQPKALPSALPSTPQQAADQLLAALDPTTKVSTADTLSVAGRACYDLVLQPKDTDSLIGSVHIAIDGQRHVPLQVQVFPKSSNKSAAFQIGFRQVSFAKPDDSVFQFTPPAGVKVTEGLSTPDTTNTEPKTEPKNAVIGTGWTSVLAARVDSASAAAGDKSGGTLQTLLKTLPQVSGAWGSGRLLSGTLFSALLTDDGRVLVGAVAPQRLLAAAADPAAALK